MSQLQSDEEDDDDYDDTNDRHQTLCEQEQELIDDSSDLGETLSQLEIFVDAFYLGGYDAASLPTLIHNICCKITELQDSVSPLDIRLCAMNKEAADLSVTVETINENAKNLKAEIEDMDLSTLLIDLEPYRIFYSRPEAMYTLIRVSVQEDLLHQYPHARSPYKRLTGEYASYSYGGEYSRAPYPCQNCSDDTSLSPAADMHVVPPRHAGWHGPSADHASDHWLVPRPSSTTFPVPGAYLFSPLLPPSHQQPYQLPYHPTA